MSLLDEGLLAADGFHASAGRCLITLISIDLLAWRSGSITPIYTTDIDDVGDYRHRRVLGRRECHACLAGWFVASSPGSPYRCSAPAANIGFCSVDHDFRLSPFAETFFSVRLSFFISPSGLILPLF